jgi:hypothetical protein
MGWLDGQNLTDLNTVSVDVFNAPLGTHPSYLGSFDANGNYTGQGYGSNLSATENTLASELDGLGFSSGSSASTSTTAPASQASLGTPSNTQPSAAAISNPPTSTVGGSIADYFTRAVIIILGFIFVAVGLGMFRSNTMQVSGFPHSQ